MQKVSEIKNDIPMLDDKIIFKDEQEFLDFKLENYKCDKYYHERKNGIYFNCKYKMQFKAEISGEINHGATVSLLWCKPCPCRMKNQIDIFKSEFLLSVPILFREQIGKKSYGDYSWQNESLNYYKEKSAWLNFKTGFGKTAFSYKLIYEKLKVKKLNLLMLDINKFTSIVINKLENPNPFQNMDLIFFDDIDKLGNITPPKQELIFSLIDYCYQNKKTLIVTSNISINEFAKRLECSVEITRRLNELCKDKK